MIPPDGEEVLSRRGDLRVDPQGNLVDAVQNQILGDGGPINVTRSSRVTIGADGTVSYVPIGETALGTVVVGRLALVNPETDTLSKGLDGNIRADGNANLSPPRMFSLLLRRWKHRVNPIASMVQMIELSRSFRAPFKP